jgi:hypothetical protein
MEDETLARLIELDMAGFILPPNYSEIEFIQSAEETLNWSETKKNMLLQEGEAFVMGEMFKAEQMVPDGVLKECLKEMTTHYRVAPNWVLAFFSNRHLPWFVGGASFYSAGNGPMRVCFLLRRAFQDRDRWLFYDRKEIIGHEACHVARAGLEQMEFEEPLAYAISNSWLRKSLGSMFRRHWEAPALLASSGLLFAGSIVEMFGAPSWIKFGSAVPLVGFGGYLTVEATLAVRKLRQARTYLWERFGDAADAVLFRCTDQEIKSLCRADREGIDVGEWLSRRADDRRWQIIHARFDRSEQPF